MLDLQDYPDPWVLADEMDPLVEQGLPEYQESWERMACLEKKEIPAS